MNTSKIELSVIIISRNEEINIERCIESIIKAIKTFQNSEIILVDSASSDRTIQIATKYPIKILQLNPSWPLSPAAGFFIGSKYSNGNYIQFQCGDSILDEGWFESAIPILKNNPKIAGVVGMISQEMYDTINARNYSEYHKNLPIGEATQFAGDSLFKRDIILNLENFNPYLPAGEEGELSYRILERGYKILRLPVHMSHHIGCHDENFSDFSKKSFKYTIAQGQILRYSLDNKNIFLKRLNEYKFKISAFLLIVIGLLSIISFILFNYKIFIFYWIFSEMLFFGWIYYENKKIFDSVKLFATQKIRSVPLLWGFLKSKKNPLTYPTNAKLIKDGLNSEENGNF